MEDTKNSKSDEKMKKVLTEFSKLYKNADKKKKGKEISEMLPYYDGMLVKLDAISRKMNKIFTDSFTGSSSLCIYYINCYIAASRLLSDMMQSILHLIDIGIAAGLFSREDLSESADRVLEEMVETEKALCD